MFPLWQITLFVNTGGENKRNFKMVRTYKNGLIEPEFRCSYKKTVTLCQHFNHRTLGIF